MRRLFSRAYNSRISGIENRRTEGYIAKMKHLSFAHNFYGSVERSGEEIVSYHELINGADVAVFAGNNISMMHTQELVSLYQKTKPVMAVDLDSHLSDFQRFGTKSVE